MAFGDFLNKFFSKEDTNSGSVAKERLRLVLVTDRADSMPEHVMEALREEMLAVITKYMDIDQEQLEFTLNRSDDEVALVANIPILRVRRDAGN